MKKIILKENIVNYLLNNTLLTENRESKNINIARKYLKDNNYSQEQAQKILDSIRTDIPNSRIAQCKFLKGVARLYLNKKLTDGRKISELNKILPYIGSDAHVNEYDNNLNNLSLDELIDRFSGLAKQDAEQSRINSNNKQHIRNTEYKIVRIPNYETASQYGDYTDWCVTYNYKMYEKYTHNGLGLFYFCLKNGFENVERIEGKNAPLDEYGLSMIAVSVDENGEPNTITSRWNHDMGGNDSVMSKDELEDLLGVNFYEIFKPYSKEELEAKKEAEMRIYREANERLKRGENPKYIFDYVQNEDGITFVKLNDKWSFIDRRGNLIGNGNLWFYSIYEFEDNGFARVQKSEDEYSFIDVHGRLIGDGNQWFDYVYTFNDGFAKVVLNNKVTLIDTNGKLISDGNQWFDTMTIFYNGFMKVELNNKWSYINENGNLIGDGNQWFDNVFGFEDGFGVVELNGKYSFINPNGKLLCNGKLWFDDVSYFNQLYDNIALITLNNEKYFIDTNGNFYDYNSKKLIPSPLKEVISLHDIIINNIKKLL